MARAPFGDPVGRRVLFAALYFSEGAPIGYLWWALPTKLREADVPVEQIGALTAALTLPWALKFLWAPVVDGLRGPRWGLRSWITLAQILMGLTLLPVVFLPVDEIVRVAPMILIAHAVCAATQDVAIDGLAVRTLSHDERGRATGWMQAGMLVGRALFGGAALLAERWIGEAGVAITLIACIWVTMALVWLAPPDVPPGGVRARERFGVLFAALGRALVRRSTWLGLGVALTAGAGFEAVGGLLGPFLIDRGADQDAVGAFLALPVVAAMIAGAIGGGWCADRFGHRALVAGSVVAIGLGVSALAAADDLGASPTALMAVALPIYLLLGVLTASSYALFMDLSDPAIGGTQFSAYMSATNMCEAWAVATAGALAGGLDRAWAPAALRDGLDYGPAFLALAGASLISLPLVWAIGNRRNAQAIAS